MKKILQTSPYLADAAFFFLLLVCLVVSGMVAYALQSGYLLNDELAKVTGKYTLFLLALFFPFIETLLWQFLPALIGQIYVKTAWMRWMLIVLPFALMHYASEAPLASLLNGFSGGIILGWMYLRYMNESHYKAMLLTFLLHAANNMLAFAG
jgi:hypothetical protein